jgi:hypothetical protein
MWLKELIVPQGTSGCEKDDEDDGSSDGEWIDISHSSEDGDAEENVDTQNKISGKKEADQKHDEGVVNDNEEEDGDKVKSFI